MPHDDGYEVSSDPSRRHVRLSLYGFLSVEDLDGLERAFGAAIKRLEVAGHPPGTYLTLVDLRRQDVQSKDATRRIDASIMSHGATSERVAVVLSGSALQRLQVRRISPTANHRLFDDEDEALRWLFGRR